MRNEELLSRLAPEAAIEGVGAVAAETGSEAAKQRFSGPSRLKQGPGKRLFVAKAEDPGLLCLDDATLDFGEPCSAAEERRKPPVRIQPREGLCVYPHLGTIEDFTFATALANRLPEQ